MPRWVIVAAVLVGLYLAVGWVRDYPRGGRRSRALRWAREGDLVALKGFLVTTPDTLPLD